MTADSIFDQLTTKRATIDSPSAEHLPAAVLGAIDKAPPITLSEVADLLDHNRASAQRHARVVEGLLREAHNDAHRMGVALARLQSRIERNRDRDRRRRDRLANGNGNGHDDHDHDARLILARGQGLVGECRVCGRRITR